MEQGVGSVERPEMAVAMGEVAVTVVGEEAGMGAVVAAALQVEV